MRDSFIFYRSFYEAIKDLPRDIQGEIYTAIMEYSLYGKETDNLKPVARSIFTLIKPQIDVNNKRFDNGCKGGRPLKKETKEKPSNNQKETKEKPNKNYNVNDNNNVYEDIDNLKQDDRNDFNSIMVNKLISEIDQLSPQESNKEDQNNDAKNEVSVTEDSFINNKASELISVIEQSIINDK